MFNIFKKRNDNRRNTSYNSENRDNGFTDPDDFQTDGLDDSGWQNFNKRSKLKRKYKDITGNYIETLINDTPTSGLSG